MKYVDYDVKSVDYDEIVMSVYTGEVCRLWVGVSGCGCWGGVGEGYVYMCEYVCM